MIFYTSNFQPPHYYYCFCQMSTMYRRQPGRYCGPHKQPCMNRPQPYPYFVDDIYEVKPPPDGEFDWIDGVNTFVDKDKTQGFQHLEQFVETVDKANEDTSCSPDDPDWYHFDDSTCLKIVGAPGMSFEDGLAECKKQGGKLWELEGEINDNRFVKDDIIRLDFCLLLQHYPKREPNMFKLFLF